MIALTVRVWWTAAAGLWRDWWTWACAAAVAVIGLSVLVIAAAVVTVTPVAHLAVVALIPLMLAGHAATAMLLPSRRPVVGRAARPRRDAPAAPGARRTRPAQGVRGGCAHTLPGGGSGSPYGVVRHPADHRPAAAPLAPLAAAAGPVAYRVGRAPVPGGVL